VVLKGNFAHYDVHFEDCVFDLVDALTEHSVLDRDHEGRVVSVVGSGQKFEIILKILFFFNKLTFLVKKLFAFLHSKNDFFQYTLFRCVLLIYSAFVILFTIDYKHTIRSLNSIRRFYLTI
jgi:hypothetical protein